MAAFPFTKMANPMCAPRIPLLSVAKLLNILTPTFTDGVVDFYRVVSNVRRWLWGRTGQWSPWRIYLLCRGRLGIVGFLAQVHMCRHWPSWLCQRQCSVWRRISGTFQQVGGWMLFLLARGGSGHCQSSTCGYYYMEKNVSCVMQKCCNGIYSCVHKI